MISLKTGINPISQGAQNGASSQTAASQHRKHYGDKSIGDVLNQVSDPNHISKKKQGHGDTNMGKEAFMTLLLTQLQNQDPTSPLESHEMAAQLAQFTSLEKLEGINKGIQGLNKKDDKSSNFAALQLIGKTVDADSSRLVRTDESQSHGIVFQLGGDASEVEVTISNRLGEAVKKQVIYNLPKGKNTFDWNGLNDDALATRKGDYSVSITAKNDQGRKIFTDTHFGGKITGVNFTAEGPVLMLGNSSIKLSEVKKIYEAAPQAPVAPKVQNQELKTQSAVDKKPELAPLSARELLSKGGGMADVKMDDSLKAAMLGADKINE